MGGVYTAVSIFTAGFLFGHYFLHADGMAVIIGVGGVGLFALTGGLNK